MTPANKPKTTSAAMYADVRRLLKKYHCQFELHQIRTRFMGAIASPIDQINPNLEIQALWQGQMPNFASIDAANEFMQVFVMGLWNEQATHFGTGHTFKLAENDPEPTEKGLKAHAKLRFEELASFMAGFFQGEDSLRVSDEISDCMDVLDDLVAMFGGLARLPKERQVPGQEQIRDLIDQLVDLTKIAEKELNQIIAISAQERQGSDSPPQVFH